MNLVGADLAIFFIAFAAWFLFATMLSPSHAAPSAGLKTAGYPISSVTACAIVSKVSSVVNVRVFGVVIPMFSACFWRNALSETFWMAFERLFNDGMFLRSIDSTSVCSVLLVSGAIIYTASADSAAS